MQEKKNVSRSKLICKRGKNCNGAGATAAQKKIIRAVGWSMTRSAFWSQVFAVCFCVWVCFVSTLEDTWLFAFHLFSKQCENS